MVAMVLIAAAGYELGTCGISLSGMDEYRRKEAEVSAESGRVGEIACASGGAYHESGMEMNLGPSRNWVLKETSGRHISGLIRSIGG